MSAEPTARTTTGVTLLRLGTGVEEYPLPEGATLADLLRLAGVDPLQHEIMIDGRPLAESVPLRPGAIVSLGPRPGGRAPEAPWRESVGMFRDDPGFEEFIQRVQAGRDAEREGA